MRAWRKPVFRRSLIAGIAVLSLGSGATALAAMFDGSSHVVRSRQHPPVPRVSTLGVTRSATLVSYCWAVEHGNRASGICADGTLGTPAHTLRWRHGVKLVADLRLPAHDVQIQAVRLDGQGGQPSHVIDLKVKAADQAGRRWAFRLPRRAVRDNALLISANFAQGDEFAELGIRPAAK